MITEWISLLGLDGDQPPWDGEPREMWAVIKIGNKEVRTKVVNIIQVASTLLACVEVYKTQKEERDQNNEPKGHYWLTRVDNLDQFTVVY